MRVASIAIGGLLLSGCVMAVDNSTRPATPAPATVSGVPAGMQYLYGSGEAAAVSRQAYAALVAHVRSKPARSVVVARGATLAQPRFATCGNRPRAIVLDVDETVLLNTGYEYSDARGGLSYDAARWERWERSDGRATQPVPGVAEALAEVRRLGVTVIFNSNRNASTARFSEAALERAGLGPARHGDTLFLKGDDATGSRKDERRWRIERRYCVVALAGDQLGDFSDLFNAGQSPGERRSVASASAVASLWGAGWFMLPNPVYGTALAGDFDDVFPNDLRWTDPGATPTSAP